MGALGEIEYPPSRSRPPRPRGALRSTTFQVERLRLWFQPWKKTMEAGSSEGALAPMRKNLSAHLLNHCREIWTPVEHRPAPESDGGESRGREKCLKRASPDRRRPGRALLGQLPQRRASGGRAGGERGAPASGKNVLPAPFVPRLAGRAPRSSPCTPRPARGPRGPTPAPRRGPAGPPAPRMPGVAHEGAERRVPERCTLARLWQPSRRPRAAAGRSRSPSSLTNPVRRSGARGRRGQEGWSPGLAALGPQHAESTLMEGSFQRGRSPNGLLASDLSTVSMRRASKPLLQASIFAGARWSPTSASSQLPTVSLTLTIGL